jgi:hypothetical protein
MADGRIDLTRWRELCAGAKNDPHPTYGQTALQVRYPLTTSPMHRLALLSAFSHLC